MRPRPLEKLSKRQRELTPPEFCRWLVDRVRERCGCHQLAALWVRHDTFYKDIEGVDCWDEERDARLYPGPHPVICHPPCGPWGKHSWKDQSGKKDDGRLFTQEASEYALHLVDQFDYGHQAAKATLLLFCPQIILW